MDDVLIESLLNESEGTSLDFKRDQYSFSGATDDYKKSELLKDILAFANAWRRTDAYILIGVEEAKGSRSKVIGITTHLSDSSLQQFVNSKTQRHIVFSYETYSYDGVLIGIILIPLQERPFYLKANYGKLEKNTVYIRRGSSTDIASPDEIAKMGLVRQDELNTGHELQLLIDELDFFAESSSIDLNKRSLSVVTDQYQRLVEKGIIGRLDKNIQLQLRDAYSEINAMGQSIQAAWASGPGTSRRLAIQEAANRRMDANAKVIIATNSLKQLLRPFND